jgi:hypothetical protein
MRETPNEVLGVDIPFHPIEGRLVKMEPLMPKHKEEVRAAIDCDPTAWSILLVNPMGAGFGEYWSANCGAPLTERLPYVIPLPNSAGSTWIAGQTWPAGLRD